MTGSDSSLRGAGRGAGGVFNASPVVKSWSYLCHVSETLIRRILNAVFILCQFQNTSAYNLCYSAIWGWSGGAMVLGKLPVPGRPTIWITVGQGPTALTVGAGGCCLDIFTLIYPFSPLPPSLWETARYRLKYCLKGPLNPKQPTNQLQCYPVHT